MTLPLSVKETKEGASFTVRVAPRARRTAITGMIGEGADAVLKIALAAPPVEGRANDALVEYLADFLDVPRSAVEIVAGQQSRKKIVRVRGRSAVQVEDALRGMTDKRARTPVD